MHRQLLFDEADARAGLPKAHAAARRLALINSEVALDAVTADVNVNNVEALIADADLVIDGTDNLQTRYLLNDACVKATKPWIYGGCVSSYGTVMPVVPLQTACLRCVFPNPAPAGALPTCDTAGVLNAASLLIASVQSSEALKVLTGQTQHCIAGMLQVDVWANTYRQVAVARDPACVCCGQRRFDFLAGEQGMLLTPLCGKNAVQIVQQPPQPIDMDATRRGFERIGTVLTANEFLLKLRVAAHEITLFADGRALIFGTDDPAVAKGVYAKYIGH